MVLNEIVTLLYVIDILNHTEICDACGNVAPPTMTTSDEN